jgi:hypothetical protein
VEVADHGLALSEDLRSHRKLPRMGMVKGPGGSCWVLELFLGMIRRLRMAVMQMVMSTTNQVIISMLTDCRKLNQEGSG